MIENATCPNCNHPAHEPGKCKQCNCGQSEVIGYEKPRPRDLTIRPRRETQNPTSTEFQGIDKGRRIKPKKTE